MADRTTRALAALGFDHGTFNVEMIWDDQTGKIQLIEVNPRLAAQFGDLYEKVQGRNTYQILLDLSVGRTPQPLPARGAYGTAASFVFREFNGAVKIAPGRAQVAWLQGAYPDALLNTYIKGGNSRWREQKWLGSYRYAVLNLGGRDRQDMFARFEHICHQLRFETTRDIHVGGYVAEARPK